MPATLASRPFWRRHAAALVMAGALPALPVHAQNAAPLSPPLENVVHLSAAATQEVDNDWLTLVLSTTREGPEAGAVQTQLKQALDAALAEARRIAKPGDVEVRTGGFSIRPRYSPKGGINGWTGSAELVVEGRDMTAIGALTGRIQSLSISRVAQSLSRELAQRVEAEITAQAVASFRAKADTSAKLFGFAGWQLREAHLSGEWPQKREPFMVMRAASPAMAGDALPVEAGKTSVTVSVNGSVQLRR